MGCRDRRRRRRHSHGAGTVKSYSQVFPGVLFRFQKCFFRHEVYRLCLRRTALLLTCVFLFRLEGSLEGSKLNLHPEFLFFFFCCAELRMLFEMCKVLVKFTIELSECRKFCVIKRFLYINRIYMSLAYILAAVG